MVVAEVDTMEAVALRNRMFAELKKKSRKKLLETDEQKKAFVTSWDWRAITEQDPDVWAHIFALLDR